MKILLIDDDKSSLNTFQEVLLLHGYDCRAFPDPVEGLSGYSDDNYDLVILDYMMPGMNGLEVAERILRINPAERIILYTGQNDPSIERVANKKGVANFFMKPIDWNKMLELINNIQ